MTLRGGVDLGGTKIQAVVVDDDQRVQGQARSPTPGERGPKGVADAIVAALREALADAGDGAGELRSIGVGSPGAVDTAAGTVASAYNVAPGWVEPYPLGTVVGGELGAPVTVVNDVKAATEAEHRLGAGRGDDALLCVFWGTGIGAGLVLRDERWLGRGAAGELGHMVVRLNGARCTCGRRGCVEAYAGRAAMERRARRLHERGGRTVLFEIMEHRGRDRLTSGVWARALEAGDELAERLLARAIAALAAGIASAINLLDIGNVVIGGGLGSRLGEPYVRRIATAMEPHLFVPERPPAVEPASLGDLGGALGAALLSADPALAPARR